PARSAARSAGLIGDSRQVFHIVGETLDLELFEPFIAYCLDAEGDVLQILRALGRGHHHGFELTWLCLRKRSRNTGQHAGCQQARQKCAPHLVLAPRNRPHCPLPFGAPAGIPPTDSPRRTSFDVGRLIGFRQWWWRGTSPKPAGAG